MVAFVKDPGTSLRRPGGIARTISAYDVIAAEYADRFMSVELVDDLELFASRTRRQLPILDAGCGHGRDCALLTSRGLRAVGLDLSSGLLSAARTTTGALVRGDVRELPIAPETFGGVWCCAVLLHLDEADFHKALSEFARVVVQGSPLFISVRYGTGEELRPERSGEARWFQFYDDETVRAIVASAGFAVTSCVVVPGVQDGRWVNLHAVRSADDSC